MSRDVLTDMECLSASVKPCSSEDTPHDGLSLRQGSAPQSPSLNPGWLIRCPLTPLPSQQPSPNSSPLVNPSSSLSFLQRAGDHSIP